MSEFDLLAVNEIEFGIDEDTGDAWIWHKDELGYEFGYYGLKKNINLHLHEKEGDSDAYYLLDDNHMISLVIHDHIKQIASVSVWNIDLEKGANPLFHLTPVELIKSSDFEQASRSLESTKSSRFIAYDYTSSFSSGGCAAMVVEDVILPSGVVNSTFSRLETFDFDKNSKRIERNLPASRINNCYEGEEEGRVLDISFIADLGYFRSFNSNPEAVKRSVEVIVANVNLIYFFQFNINVRLQQLMVVNNNVGSPIGICFTGVPVRTQDLFSMDPNDDSLQCCALLDRTQTQLERFSASTQRGKPSVEESYVNITESLQLIGGREGYKAAHWHWLTDCFPADCGLESCEVGMSVLRSTGSSRGFGCEFSSGRNFGMSSRTFQTWVVVAHELAHNFGGAGHSFEKGRGRTGGLMDYGDGKIEGTYEFGVQRKDEFCSSISSYVDNNICFFGGQNYFSSAFNECEGAENFTRLDCGVCFNEICEPYELQIRAIQNGGVNDTNPDLFPIVMLVEPSEFSPSSLLSLQDFGIGFLKQSNPTNGCNSLIGNFTDRIVLIERGECVFTQKVDNALKAGAVGVIIFNNEEGAPKVLGGENFQDINAVSVSQSDGQRLQSLLNDCGEEECVQVAIGGFVVSGLSLDFEPLSFFEEYFIAIVSFCGFFLVCNCLWFTLRGFDKIKKRCSQAKEVLVDATVENKYRLIDAYDNARQSFRLTRGQINREEIERLREEHDDTDEEIEPNHRSVDV